MVIDKAGLLHTFFSGLYVWCTSKPYDLTGRLEKYLLDCSNDMEYSHQYNRYLYYKACHTTHPLCICQSVFAKAEAVSEHTRAAKLFVLLALCDTLAITIPRHTGQANRISFIFMA
jgi:hypothetical protein